MAPKSGQDIYGFFEPRHVGDASSIDRMPVRLPHVIREDEVPQLEYPPIDAHTQIRLITLLPAENPSEGGNSMDPVQCTLQVCSLAQASEYEALSYTWGSIHRHLPISVLTIEGKNDGMEVCLFGTPQLLMALRRLRGATPRRLWIDQLCINQEDKKECGAQVQLMGDIYRTASRVIIWLGEDHEELTTTADGRLETETQRQHLLALSQAFASKSENDGDDATVATQMVDLRPTHHYADIRMRRMGAVRNFLNRPYFSRAWVFQESSLARELIVQLGQQEFDFSTLKRVFDGINNAAIVARAHRDQYSSLAAGTRGYEMMNIIQETREEQLCSGNVTLSDRSSFLLKLLTVLRRVNCYQKQDLIFAFLAFQRNEGITATGGMYEKPVEEVWRYAAERIIRSSESLDIFAASFGGLATPSLTIPTWVPCWSNCFPFTRPISTPLSKFRASRDIPHVWAGQDDPTKLHVRGKIIDKIEAIHGHFGHFQRWKHNVWQFLLWDCVLQSVRFSMVSPKFIKLFGDYLPVKRELIALDLMTTVLADGALGVEQPLRRIDKYLYALNARDKPRDLRKCERTLDADEKRLIESYDKLEDLILVAEHKCIFTTDHFQMGMAAHVTEPGDLVAILQGSRTPCVLRKVEEMGNSFKLISQCYLHGWMYGKSPREVFGKDPKHYPQLKVTWEEDLDDFVLV